MWIEPNTFRTRFRHLVTSGCSFTSNLTVPDGGPFAWPNMLAMWCGLEIHNLAVPGAGNDHTARSLILYLEKNNLDPSETLVLPMWSGAGRIDWITDQSLSKFGTQYPFEYKYDDVNELTLGGHWWNIKRPTHLTKTLQEYSKYQSDASFALTTWLAMESVKNYLLSNKYTFYFTSFFSLDVPVSSDAYTLRLTEELKKIQLTLDMKYWLPLADKDYYGNWCSRMGMITDDGFHPGKNANLAWPGQILVPCLTKLGIIDE